MVPNDVLRSLRYALKLTDSGVAQLIHLGGGDATPQQVIAWLKGEEEPGYVPCSDLVLAQALNGLITQRRGPRENAPPPESRLDNNLVLKKLRVAFELKEEDILALMAAAGFGVSKPELSALFRKPDHKNYRPAGDQFLRNFLKGLAARYRG
jgi:uncharacterized protein YehS (DUF1456 family)